MNKNYKDDDNSSAKIVELSEDELQRVSGGNGCRPGERFDTGGAYGGWGGFRNDSVS